MKFKNWIFSKFTHIIVFSLTFSMLAELCGPLGVFAMQEISDAAALLFDSEPEVVSLDCTNDAGDYTYFDNHYCQTSIAPQYYNFTPVQKTNYIECYRLDYDNPKRKDMIYLEKTDKDNDCYFDISCKRSGYTRYTSKKYDYFLVSGDFMTTVPGARCQMFLFRDSETSTANADFVSASFTEDGSLVLADGTEVPLGLKPGEWFNIKTAVNLKNHTADIYINGYPAGTVNINEKICTINTVRLSLLSGTGNMYTDNFSVTGLEIPFENGVETKTDVFPDNPQIEQFLEGKVGLHGYGKLMYKNGVKSPITPEPVYDADECELYMEPSAVNAALGTSLAYTSDGALAGGSLSVSGDAAIYNGKTYKLKHVPRLDGGRLLVPVTELAGIIGKYVFSMENGIIVISDQNQVLDVSDWQYPCFRPDFNAITLMNDVDFLNSFLCYDRPESDRLKSDFSSVVGSYTSHPRILADKDDFDRLRELYNYNNDYKALAGKLIAKANSYASREPLVYKFDDTMRMYSSGAETQTRFMLWGYAYQITGSDKYVIRAVKELEALNKFPDFNPLHIIDSGMFCMGLAVAYDWFYEAFDEEQRELAKQVCFDKCYKSLSNAYFGRLSHCTSGNGAIRWMSNYNAVVSGGCLNAAIATLECDPDYNMEVISACLKSLEYSLMGIMPGGGWSESLSYWNYTMEFLSYAMASLNVSFGSNYGIENSQGMESTLKYAMSCIGTDGIYNYHDAGQSAAPRVISYKTFMYLAGIYHLDDAYGMRINDIFERNAVVCVEDGLFYNPDIDVYGDIYDKSGTDFKIDGTELFSSRDTYNMSDSQFYFAAHFGSTSGYHQHNDCGSFILDMYGTRFADDLGADNYNLENELKYPSYAIYRRRAEGHNTMVFNPANHSSGFEQQQKQFAPITEYDVSDSASYVKANLKNVYSEAPDMKQGYYLDKENMSVTYRAEFTTSPATEMYWFMHTRADVEIDGDKAYLTRGGHTVCVRFETNGTNAEIMKTAAEPLPTSPQVPEQNKNTAFTRIAINVNTNGSSYLNVNICPVENSGSEIMNKRLAVWSLSNTGEEGYEDILGYTDFEDFGAITGAGSCKITDICGKHDGDSGIRIAPGAAAADVLSKSFESKNRYTVFSFNIIPERTDFEISDLNGGVLLSGEKLLTDKWNSVYAVYDNAENRALSIINGSYSDWTKCGYSGGGIKLKLIGSRPNSYADIDNCRIYTSSEIPEVKAPSIGGVTMDGAYIMSDGTLRAEDILSDCTVIAYADSGCTERMPAGTALPEGSRVVVENGDLYSYYTVTLQQPQQLPQKMFQFEDDFDGINVERGNILKTDDIFGRYGSCALISGAGGAESNFYVNISLPVGGEVKTVSIDVLPVGEVKALRFATNSHVALSARISLPQLRTNEWNNLKLVMHPDTNVNELYINGEYVSSVTCAMAGSLRLVVDSDSCDLSKAAVYADNFVIYRGELDAEPFEKFGFSRDFSAVYGAVGITAAEFKNSISLSNYKFNYVLYDSNGTLAGSDIITDKCTMRVYGGELLLGTYIFK